MDEIIFPAAPFITEEAVSLLFAIATIGFIFSHGFRAIVPLAIGPDHGDQKNQPFLARRTIAFAGLLAYQARTHLTNSLSEAAFVGAAGSHGTSGPV